MLKPRIIPTLLLRNNRMVKGVNFKDYKDTGDPISASKVYNSQFVDELIFIDIDATTEQRDPNYNILKEVSKECFMPFTFGGGIQNIQQIRKLLKSGADKVIINSSATNNQEFIHEAVQTFGSQCIVIAIDVKKIDKKYRVFTHSGRKKYKLLLDEYLDVISGYNVGEIFINSIDQDGKMNGYDNDLINFVTNRSMLPVIACGGAGNFMHIYESFIDTNVSALAMASIFHFSDNNPIRCRSFLKNKGIDLKVV
jgi:cyclase